MLEKGSDSEELLGRIRTLKDKYGELQEAPTHLSDSSVSHWERSISRADSILDTLGGKLQKKGEGDPKGRMKQRIDRILQRLAVQARSMENAKGRKAKRPSP